MTGSDTCVCGGCDVPEGRQVCPSCETKLAMERRERKKSESFIFGIIKNLWKGKTVRQ